MTIKRFPNILKGYSPGRWTVLVVLLGLAPWIMAQIGVAVQNGFETCSGVNCNNALTM